MEEDAQKADHQVNLLESHITNVNTVVFTLRNVDILPF